MSATPSSSSRLRTFRHGVHPAEYKQATSGLPIERMPFLREYVLLELLAWIDLLGLLWSVMKHDFGMPALAVLPRMALTAPNNFQIGPCLDLVSVTPEA